MHKQHGCAASPAQKILSQKPECNSVYVRLLLPCGMPVTLPCQRSRARLLWSLRRNAASGPDETLGTRSGAMSGVAFSGRIQALHAAWYVFFVVLYASKQTHGR